MIALMVATFMSFFIFVVNTGLLVNAKINLQNAADLAAYAGASAQARQLNNIAFLNYEMRRQYKKFLFRYYIVGNFSQSPFPGAPDADGNVKWSPDGSANYGAPIVCINFSTQDNVCQAGFLPGIPQIQNPGFLDSIGQVFSENLKALEEIRGDNCEKISQTNERVLLLWLFNPSDETGTVIPSSTNGDPSEIQVYQQISGVSAGIGLIPKEILLSRRIKTLETYVNLPPQRVTLENLPVLENPSQTEVAFFERPIQAFKSAFNTLGEYTFDADSITLTEILPGAGGSAAEKPLLDLKELEINFDTYFLKFDSVQGGCKPVAVNIPIQKMPIGFHKDPKKLVFYSVQLQAKANLLFNPFSDLTLKAYAAAQPFGSRIGPKNPDFVQQGQPKIGNPNCSICALPNLAVSAGDTIDKGWNQRSLLNAMFNTLGNQSNATGGKIITTSILRNAYQSAMVPNPIEAGQYNIPYEEDAVDPDGTRTLTGDPFVRLFRGGFLNIWAPLFPRGTTQEEINTSFATVVGQSLSSIQSTSSIQSLQDSLVDALGAYVAKLRNFQDGGEDRENFNIARIRNPYEVPESLPSSIQLDDALAIKDSYPSTRSDEFASRGRLGYSVKFVSFDYLFNPKSGSADNDLNLWTNVESMNLPSDILADIKESKKLMH